MSMGAGTNRNFPTYKDDEGFRRIAVLLLSLAALAEEAALRSLPVRWLMLWLLRPAEEAARNFAADAGFQLGFLAPMGRDADPGLVPGEAERGIFADGSDLSPAIYPNDRLGNGPGGEAARLAWIFRTLAAFFFDLSYQAASMIYVAWQQCQPAGDLRAARLYSLLAASRPCYADTS